MLFISQLKRIFEINDILAFRTYIPSERKRQKRCVIAPCGKSVSVVIRSETDCDFLIIIIPLSVLPLNQGVKWCFTVIVQNTSMVQV